jgi:hypothetical protein
MVENNDNNNLLTNEVQEIADPPEIDIAKNQYLESIKCYFIFILYGSIGGILFNALFNQDHRNIINFDMMINGIISPVIYYHSPRHILMKTTRKTFFTIYTPCYIVGLSFRFLDLITELNTFTINPSSIDTPLEITMACLVSLLIFAICVFYILSSKFPLINAMLFIVYLVAMVLASYYFYTLDGTIHYHHYSIGLTVMLISRNHHSNVVIAIHAISYGVYIDGISRWGFDPIYSIK